MLPKMTDEELANYLIKDYNLLKALNFNENYIKTTTENTSKWAKVGLLRGVEDAYIGRNVAALMENQRLFNEQMQDKTNLAQYKRISIPLIRRIFAQNFIGYQLVSVQTMNKAIENAYIFGFDGRTQYHPTESKTRKLDVSWNIVEQIANDPIKHTILDQEAQFTANLANKVCIEFSREIIRDLASNAGKLFTYKYQDETHLLSLIEGMSTYIGSKCYQNEANWIVTSSKIIELLKDKIEFKKDNVPAEINYIGILNEKWRVFEDTKASDGDILMGFKSPHNHYFSGYVFCPYLPVVLSEKNQLLARYDKKLINADFYGTVRMHNLPEITPLEKKIEEINLDSEGEE